MVASKNKGESEESGAGPEKLRKSRGKFRGEWVVERWGTRGEE